ncbi:hypothetical protein POTOM_035358 [Populus tomentosa]|uniref:Uncharacterized protein n=1 Tax=Populus tomentosa TaxID=118781 RepID=A0A8X7YYS7_POPTO|nr:hypothetical protein POTOM_035358 [Populus tomentosa]
MYLLLPLLLTIIAEERERNSDRFKDRCMICKAGDRSSTLKLKSIAMIAIDIELSELKKSLNVEVVQLRTEFQELKNTLQQQQEDVTASLRNLGLQDSAGDGAQEAQEPKVDVEDQEVHSSAEEDVEKKDEN